MSKRLLIPVLIIALAAGSFLFVKYRVAPKVVFNKLELTTLDGQPYNIASLQGKKVFINFFATWCGPCIAELPQLQQAQQKLKNDGFVFICIADESIERLKYLDQRMGGNLLLLHAKQKLSTIDVFTYPTNYLLSGSGQIVFKQTGVLDWDKESTYTELKELAK